MPSGHFAQDPNRLYASTMDPVAEAIAGEPRSKQGAAMDAPDAASWLHDPTAHAAKPLTHNKRIIAALLAEIARGDVCTEEQIAAYNAAADKADDEEAEREPQT